MAVVYVGRLILRPIGPVFCLILLGIVAPSIAADETAENKPLSFTRDIAPIFARQCQACHGPEKSKSKYRLDTFARLTKIGAGDDEPIVAGKPGQSGIYKRLIARDEDDRMPQKADPLPQPQIAMIRRWIEQGARFDGSDPAAPIGSLSTDSRQPAPLLVYTRPVPIAALAFSPDGKLLAASGYHEVLLWDAADGHLVLRLPNIPRQVLSLAYSPDGKRLAVAGGTPGSQGELRLIDLSGATPAVQLLERISDVMTVVRFSPDGAKLAAGGADNAIRIYDPATGKRERLIEQHADWITDLAFNSDGVKIVSASRDKSSRIFDTRTGAMLGAYVESEEPLYAAAWSDDGKRIFSSSRDHKIHMWNAVDSKKVGEIPLPEADVFRLQTAPGLLIACSSDGNVTSYSQKDRSLVRNFGRLPDWAYSLAIDPARTFIAAGCEDGSIVVWTMDGGAEVCRFLAAPGLNNVSRR